MLRNGPEGSNGKVEQRGISDLLAGRAGEVVLLALVSLAGGLLEAAFLVSVTRAAFAITEGDERFGVFAGVEMTVGQLIAVSVVVIVVRTALALLGNWQAARLGAGVVSDVRRRFADAYLGAEWAARHGERGGRLQELMTSYAQRAADLIAGFTLVLSSACNLAGLLGMAFLVDVAASGIAALALGVLGLSLRPLRGLVRGQARRVSTTGMEFATAVSEVSELGMEMHVFHVQRATRSRLGRLIDASETAMRRLSTVRGAVPNVYTGLAYLALLVALAVVAHVDAASLTSVGAVMLLMLRSLGYAQGLQQSMATISSSLPFVSTLDEAFDHYERRRLVDHGEPVGEVGCLSLQDVSFEYEPGQTVLRGVTARFEPREVVGVIGPSGSGKSTLVQLLLGLRTPTAGIVQADGRDITVLARAEWARKVTFVPQQARLVAGTISDNIRFFRDDVSEADVERAARLAHLHEDVVAFPEGYDRQVGERGSHLSGGQQQRLVIARALVEDPDVLILDEPTSSLDVRSESLIRETLDELRRDMTIIVIAHRLSTLEICDRLMVIQDGEVRGFDTPANLERDSAFYREALELSGLR